jgi:hypothetical protein
MSKTYIGWVSTVLGNLSFKSIGHSGYPYPFILSFKENAEGHIDINCLQKRVPADYQIPFLPLSDRLYLNFCSYIGSKFFKENIESAFVLVGGGKSDKTKTVQDLKGKIYKISRQKRSDQKESYSELFHLLDKNEQCTIEEELERYLKEHSFFVCEFSLNRQGICKISDAKAGKDGIGCNLSEEEIHKQVNQCFFFLKDSFHSHKHHNKSEDTLVSTHLDIDENGVQWSEHVLKKLYRYILNRRPILNNNSLGIFSYLRTFSKIIKNKGKPGVGKSKTLFDRIIAIDELEKSISIQIQEKEESILYRRWFLGFSLAVAQMFSFYIYSSDKESYNEIIANNTVGLVTLAVSLLLVILVFTKNINPKTSKVSIRFVNLVISFFDSKNRVILFLVSLGVLVMTVGLYFL